MKFRYLTLLLLAATIALLTAFGQRAYAEPAVIDDFDDNSIGGEWTETNTGTGASLSETNGRLEFHFDADSREGPAPPGAPFGDVSTGVRHECNVSGDFEVQVDFDVSGWPEENGVRVALAIGSFSVQRDWDAIFGNVYVGGISGVAHRVNTTATTGSLRLLRMDSTWTASYNEGGGWQNIASGSGSEDPASLRLRAWTHNHLLDARPEESAEMDIDVSLDNLNLENGDLTCGDHKVEVTQGVQKLQTVPELIEDLDGDGEPPVPIVAGKPAALRVLMEEVDATSTWHVGLSGDVTGNRIVQLDPGCTLEERRTGENNCRSVDFFFTPPAGDWSVTVTIRKGAVGPVHEAETLKFTSRNTATLLLKPIPVCDSVLASNPAPLWNCGSTIDLLLHQMPFLRQMYPGEVSLLGQNSLVFTETSEIPQDGDWWEVVNDQIRSMWIADSQFDNVYYHGIVRPQADGGTAGGIAFTEVVNASAGKTMVSRPSVSGGLPGKAGQELLSHLLFLTSGAEYVPSGPGCYGTPIQTASGWPGGGSPEVGEVGYNTEEQEPVPEDHADLMSFCTPRWVSEFTYGSLLEGVTLPASPSLAQGDYWLVSGEIDEGDGTTEFNPIFELETEADAGPGAGFYRIEVLDGSDSVLFTRDMMVDRQFKEDEGAQSGPDSDVVNFAEMIPVQAGAAKISVFALNQPVGTLLLGGLPPVVTLTQGVSASPSGGSGDGVPISWSVADGDGGSHVHWLQLSLDGGETWRTIAPGYSKTSITLDPAFTGGSDEAVLRILASDGVNTGVAESAPFVLPQQAPEAQIVAPDSGGAVLVGSLIWLQAAAFDAEDGVLDSASVTWSSNLDGALGTGASLHVYDLSEGTHTITMTAKDSDNNEVTDSIVVTVYDAPLVEGEAAIKGDNDCDDDVDSVDALKGLQHNAGLPVAQPDGCPPIGSGGAGAVFGDIDCDDDVDSVDSLSILRNVAGLAANLPPGCKPIGV